MISEVELFFKRVFEKQINNKLFYYDYKLDKEEIRNYIEKINSTPYIEFIDYVVNDENNYHISSRDVFQFSSLNDSTEKICMKLELNGDKGYRYNEIGLFLLDDGINRNDIALKKYGENQSKTAEELGLVQYKSYYCFLTCIGKLYAELNIQEKNKLLSRLVLRNYLIRSIVKSSYYGITNVKELISFLSDSTIKRRLPNIKKMMQLVIDNSEQPLDNLQKNIKY